MSWPTLDGTAHCSRSAACSTRGRSPGLPDGQLLERFLARGDEAAFAALVRRHGPMVLGTCRAVLRDPNDAEDAFQATFLVLICKARSIRRRRRPGHLAPSGRASDRPPGRRRGRASTDMRATGPATSATTIALATSWATTRRQILHEELARLSEKYRLPLLLCDLEGKSHAQAAIELNCGEATVRRRLAGARDLLRPRLVRRGVALATGGLATVLGRSALAKVPPGWVETTVQAAGPMSSTAARIAIGDVVSTTAADLARKLLRTMYLSKLKSFAALSFLLVALGGIAWGLGIMGQDEGGMRQADRMQNPGSTPTAPPLQPRAEKPPIPMSPSFIRDASSIRRGSLSTGPSCIWSTPISRSPPSSPSAP